jgi:ribosome biogenesis GTPase A
LPRRSEESKSPREGGANFTLSHDFGRIAAMKTSTSELQELADNAVRAITGELLPKANSYFASPETTKFFNERLVTLRKELNEEPRFRIHLLGSSQNGKSTLVNVLLGKKILGARLCAR